MLKIIIILVITFVSSSCSSRCRYMKGIQKFDLNILSGQWYELKRTPFEIEENETCVTYVCKCNGDNILRASSNYLPANSPKFTNAVVNWLPNENNEAEFLLSYGRNDNVQFNVTGKYLVLEDDYVILYGCEEDNEKNVQNEYVWLYGRTPQLHGETLKKINKQLDTIIDSSKIITIDNSNCNNTTA